MLPERIFYKYTKINENYTFDMIENKYFYFSRPSQLNDPEDCRCPLLYDSDNKTILKWIKHAKKLGKITGEKRPFPLDTVAKVRDAIKNTNYKNTLEESYKKTVEQFHILSLANAFDNKKLWTHPDYNDNFSGICLGFKSVQLQYPDYDTWFIRIKSFDVTRYPYMGDLLNIPCFVLKKSKL